MLWIIRILLTLPAMLVAWLVGHDLLDFGFVGSAVVFVFIIGFAIWATERTIRSGLTSARTSGRRLSRSARSALALRRFRLRDCCI